MYRSVQTCCLVPRLLAHSTACHRATQQACRTVRHTARHTARQTARQAGSKPRIPPEEVPHSFTQRGWSGLIKPFAFTVVVSAGSFAGAAIWQYESILGQIQNAMQKSHAQASNHFYGKAGSLRHRLNTWWNELSPGKKTVACLIGLNLCVFALWKATPLQNFMHHFFVSSPMSSVPCGPMVFSTFSHNNLVHLALNMYVLWSFSEVITQSLGREQFLAFFLTAGVVSSLASYARKIALPTMAGSLGASGAIMGVLGYVCCQFPDARLSIAFVGDIIPHSFSSSSAMVAVLTVDTLGVLLRWTLMDHAAHLGGMLFGILYSRYGKDIWKAREPWLKKWHKIRGQPTPGR